MVSTRASLAYTSAALTSFAAHTELGPADRFVLIDNDRSFSAVLPPRFELQVNATPLGFAANFNSLIQVALAAKADLYLLNNDLIFTAGWSEPLASDIPAILSPLSNREVQYAHSVVVPKTGHVAELTVFAMQFSLAEYLGKEAAFASVIDAHRRMCSGYQSVYVAPFFCAKIPNCILAEVGVLDEQYGRGGGEDFDYCLRTHLAGFTVAYALNSFVLHFGGKSSWSGVETSEEQLVRECKFRDLFRKKWGDELFQLILREDSSMLELTPDVVEQNRSGQLASVIRSLLGTRTVSLAIPCNAAMNADRIEQ